MRLLQTVHLIYTAGRSFYRCLKRFTLGPSSSCYITSTPSTVYKKCSIKVRFSGKNAKEHPHIVEYLGRDDLTGEIRLPLLRYSDLFFHLTSSPDIPLPTRLTWAVETSRVSRTFMLAMLYGPTLILVIFFLLTTTMSFSVTSDYRFTMHRFTTSLSEAIRGYTSVHRDTVASHQGA